ncbi:metallophosphoesterase [Halalkalicoccus salilacus]|uniref:metallophosphoesterase n=1 Tax=Halalkalicoccus salilacus TaxID=3117459 RepID=UPI00300EB7D4
MIVVCSDTHSNGGHELTDHMLNAVHEADLVLHAGDFTSEATLDAFHGEAARLFAVFGNADDPAVRERLPVARTVEWEGLRIAVTHRRDGGSTGLAMFGRERGADLVISGHSHRPSITRADDLVLLNPGSHARPRGNRPGYAELEAVEEGVRCRLGQPDGTLIEEVTL